MKTPLPFKLSRSRLLVATALLAAATPAVAADCSPNPLTGSLTGGCNLTGGTFTVDPGGSVVASSGAAISNAVAGSSLINRGVVSGTDTDPYTSYGLYSTTSMKLINNSGSITSNGGYAIYLGDSLDSIVNSGTISAVAFGLHIDGASTTVNTVDNSGTITGIQLTGAIGTLTNTGTISNPGGPGIYVWSSLYTWSKITTLNNAQGAGNAAGALIYYGKLPTYYNVIINSAASYGQLATSSFFSSLGTTTFGIAAGSRVSAGTYSSVLSGEITASSLNNKSGNYGVLYDWSLSPQTGSPTTWDLAVTRAATGVAGQTAAAGNALAGDAARVIDANESLYSLFGGLTTGQQVADATTQTLPVLFGASAVATRGVVADVGRIVQNRQLTTRGMASGDSFYGDRQVWLKPFASRADQDRHNGVDGYQANSSGLIFGVDGELSPAVRVGGAFAYAHSQVDGTSDVARQNADIDLYQLIGYGSYAVDAQSELSVQAGIGHNSNHASRQIALTSSIARSAYDSTTAFVGAAIDRRYALGAATTLTPSRRADYFWVDEQGYTETGADLLNLRVEGRRYDALVVGVDGRVDHQMGETTRLTANLGVGYDTINQNASITSAYAGAPGALFVTSGVAPDPWIVRGGIGVSQRNHDGLQIMARYDAEHRTGFLNQTASVSFRWPF